MSEYRTLLGVDRGAAAAAAEAAAAATATGASANTKPITTANPRAAFSAALSSLYGPGKAVDGLASTADNSSIFISESEPQPWLSLDLMETMIISRMVIFNRKDCCGELGYQVNAGGAAVDNITKAQLIHYNDIVYTSGSSNQTANATTILINPPMSARYIVVQSIISLAATGTSLQVLELEVYGIPAACTLLPQYGMGYGDDAAALSTSSEPDAGACCQACYTSPTCLYWDFDLANRTCRLKGDQAGAIPPGKAIPGFWLDTNRVAGGKRGAHVDR
ncbi:hypothetical protein PLESTF_001430100 [Pleodorina starrii]|nr:hypothetical protein PLESTF_001430100 [Pleodorina starrii]